MIIGEFKEFRDVMEFKAYTIAGFANRNGICL